MSSISIPRGDEDYGCDTAIQCSTSLFVRRLRSVSKVLGWCQTLVPRGEFLILSIFLGAHWLASGPLHWVQNDELFWYKHTHGTDLACCSRQILVLCSALVFHSVGKRTCHFGAKVHWQTETCSDKKDAFTWTVPVILEFCSTAISKLFWKKNFCISVCHFCSNVERYIPYRRT